MDEFKREGDRGVGPRKSGKSEWRIGIWLGLASLAAILVGAVMHLRSLMACGPIILVVYFGYLLYCLVLKSDVPADKTDREANFDGR